MNAKGCSSPWAATVLTLFPDMFPGPLGQSLAGKALQTGIWSLKSLDIRAFAGDKHRSVDAPPFGGGPGMVLRPDVMDAALASLDKLPGRRIYLSPRGKCFDQSVAEALVEDPGVVLICGRFEGLDQRLIDARKLEEISLGDYVLSGGEIASLAVLDTCVRLLPGVLGSKEGTGRATREGRARLVVAHVEVEVPARGPRDLGHLPDDVVRENDLLRPGGHRRQVRTQRHRR